MSVGQSGTIEGSVAQATYTLSGRVQITRLIDRDHYAGSYEVTPSAVQQSLQTSGLVMDQDVTIAPIPSNYGLVTYNGTSITIS